MSFNLSSSELQKCMENNVRVKKNQKKKLNYIRALTMT